MTKNELHAGQQVPDDAQLLADEAKYCSFGDTVHYVEHPNIFAHCEGSYMYDTAGKSYLDLQMWYSAVNFGYGNERLNNVLKRQIDILPQTASQYLHPTKIQLAKVIAEDMKSKFGLDGRVHFNVGGSQSIEDSLKLVRNATHGKSLMFAFEGGYHGRTLGASSITSSYRYRRRYGHFGDRAQFIPFPYPFRRPKGMTAEEYGEHCVNEFARLFETEYNGVWDPKVGESEYAAFYIEPIQGTGGYVVPPMNFFKGIKKVLDQYGILLVVDEVQMGFYRTGKLWSIEHFGVTPDILVFAKSLTNGLNPLGTALGLEVMQMLKETDYETMVMAKGAHFLEGLKDLQKRHKEIGDVDGLGLALRAEICTDDGFTPNKALLDKMVEIGLSGDLDWKGKKMGLILDVGGYYKNVITLAPSLHITTEEIDQGLALLDQLITRAKNA